MRLSKFGKYKREEVTEFDKFLYVQLHKLIQEKSTRIASHLPEFIVYESLIYFLENEKFEEYNIIKGYLILNTKKVVQMSRKDWIEYGWRGILKVKRDDETI
jgi:hypothetical protein|tara:strand:- start:2805 stop:3110 length:306 start_codon:yes stop_codon:yes gene_type:complete